MSYICIGLKLKEMDNYYKDQLSKINTDEKYPATIKVSSTKTDTKWMGLNPESARALVDWLTEKFLTDEKRG